VSPAEGPPFFFDLPGSVPLGAARHARYDEHDFELEPGAALVLYTDGLVERSGESLDTGLERLATAVRRGADDLEHLGDHVVDVMLPEGPGDDDAALLMARALPLGDALVATFPAEIDSIPLMRRLLGRWLDEAGATRTDIEDLMLRAWTAHGGPVKVTIRDFGNWRAPRGTHRGRGLVLMEGLADAVEVIQSEQGTTVELSRRIGAQAA
jgi:hypothetical protein